MSSLKRPRSRSRARPRYVVPLRRAARRGPGAAAAITTRMQRPTTLRKTLRQTPPTRRKRLPPPRRSSPTARRLRLPRKRTTRSRMPRSPRRVAVLRRPCRQAERRRPNPAPRLALTPGAPAASFPARRSSASATWERGRNFWRRWPTWPSMSRGTSAVPDSTPIRASSTSCTTTSATPSIV